MTTRSGGRSEDGAVAITTAILLTVLVMFAAIVVDLGLLRVDRSDNQLVADSAAVAGVLALRSENATPWEACVAAWAYAVRNLPEVPDTSPEPCTAEMGTTYACDLNDVKTPEDTIGGTTIRIVYPVLEKHPLMKVQDPSDPDGTDPCERLGVLITTERNYRLGVVAGFNEGATTTGAVGRTNAVTETEQVAALVVLDPTGCEVATVSSDKSKLLVGEDPTGQPGIITIDSDGDDCLTEPSQDYAIRMSGSNARLCAGLRNLAAAFGGAECDSEPGTLFTPSQAFGRDVSSADDPQVHPTIQDGAPATREPIDHRYNCKNTGYASGPNAQIYSPIVDTCDRGTASRPTNDRAHIDQLAEHFQPSATSPGDWLGGVSDWSNQSCDVAAADTDNDDEVDWVDESKNLYFDCDLVIPNGMTLRLDALQYIVVNGSINVAENATLEINTDSDLSDENTGPGDQEDLTLVVLGEDSKERAINAANGTDIRIHRTFGYLKSGRIEARSDNFQWIAPNPVNDAYDEDREPAACALTTHSLSGDKLPSPECFEDLVVWSNHEGEHLLTSGGFLDIRGIFFTPHAGYEMSTSIGGPFLLTGGGDQQLEGAQFFSHRFELFGGAKISLTPDPRFNEPIVVYFTGLIR